MTGPDVDTDPRRCACGCTVAAHRHYRPGTDCGACGDAVCPSYQPAGPLPISPGLQRLLLVVLGVPAVVVALFAAGAFAGDWAVYTMLVVIVVLAIFLMTAPDGDRP